MAAWKFALTDWVKPVAEDESAAGRHKLDMSLDEVARARRSGGGDCPDALSAGTIVTRFFVAREIRVFDDGRRNGGGGGGGGGPTQVRTREDEAVHKPKFTTAFAAPERDVYHAGRGGGGQYRTKFERVNGRCAE